MVFDEKDLDMLLRALNFAATKHRNQRRKGRDTSPYVNHPIHVLTLLWEVGQVRAVPTLAAAVLHDTLEDTDTTTAELEQHFGAEVRTLVQEVSDDKSLPKDARKQLQIEHAPHISVQAKLIKLADKIDNIRDIVLDPPADWSHARLVAYLDWSIQVVAGLRGCNAALEARYDQVLAESRTILTRGS